MFRVFITYLVLFLSLGCLAGKDQVQFKKRPAILGGHQLTVEVADTPELASRGLMFRRSLDSGQGMLFIFPDEDVRSFWMKNTFIALDIGFFSADKTLVDIQTMVPVKSEMETNLPSYISKKPAKYALEVPAGWFRSNKITIGTKLIYKD